MPVTITTVYTNDFVKGYKPYTFTISPSDWVAEGTYYKYTKSHTLNSTDILADIHIVGGGNEQALVGLKRRDGYVTVYWNNNTDTLRVKLLRPEEASG